MEGKDLIITYYLHWPLSR